MGGIASESRYALLSQSHCLLEYRQKTPSFFFFFRANYYCRKIETKTVMTVNEYVRGETGIMGPVAGLEGD